MSTSGSKKVYTGPRYAFKHGTLGELTGRLISSTQFPDSPVVQFRSIPFATVPKRFSPSVLATEIPYNFDNRSHRDFTAFGAACPQTGGSNSAWPEPYGGWLEDELDVEFNEFTCLTVSISVPKSHLETIEDGRKLPVMIYVHGGGASDGMGHVDGLHCNAPLTAYADTISKPVITVNIGYRLNWLGSLVCQDMIEEYHSDRQSPHGPFNLTIQDQRNAFAWIQQFIGGFGGDATNITAFGESAGSTFLVYHICGSATRLFDRAILQSGTIFGDLPLEAKDAEYQAMLKHFSIEGTTATARLDALRQVNVNDLVNFPGSHMTPYVGDIPGVNAEDSLFTRGSPTVTSQMDLIPSCSWLGDLIIGDNFWEGDIVYPMMRRCPQNVLVKAVNSLFPKPQAEDLLAAYDLSRPISSVRAGMQMSVFLGDLLFSFNYHTLAKALASKSAGDARNVYRYHFCLSNLFPGSAHSFTTGHHFVEILYIFLTLFDRYPTHRNEWAKRQALETARRWIAFANGEEPWEAYSASNNAIGRIAIADDLRGWTTRTISDDERVSKDDPWGERRYSGWNAFEQAFDALRVANETHEAYGQRVTAIRLQLLQLAFGYSSTHS